MGPTDKLHENYSEASLDIESHIMFDALYTEKNEFIACTGIYRRPQWPEGAYRLLNRTFFSPAFRAGYHFDFFASDYLLPPQVRNCKKTMEFTFVSRQGKNGGLFLKKLNDRTFFKNSYKVSELFIQVVPGGHDIKCFQKILYSNKTKHLFKFNAVKDLQNLSEIIEVNL